MTLDSTASPLIDVSEHQGLIDFQTCAAAGVPLAIPRAGINGRLDVHFDRNVAGFHSVDIVVPAAYWFINPKSQYDATAQGNLARIACGRWGIRTMMLDAEWYANEGGPNPVIKGQPYVDFCRRFIDALDEVTPIIYTSASFWDDYSVDPSTRIRAEFADLAALDTIIADYRWQPCSTCHDPIADSVHPSEWADQVFGHTSRLPSLPRGWDGTIEGWQFSAGGNAQGPVYGMKSGDLDLNIADPAAVARWVIGARPGEVVPPKPRPPIPPIKPPQPPTTGVSDVPLVIKNTEPYPTFAGGGEQSLLDVIFPGESQWPAESVYWTITDDNRKAHLTGDLLTARRAQPGYVEVGMTTGQIQQIPGA